MVLDEQLDGGLKDLSRRQGTTLYMTLLAGWAILLARLSGQQDVVIGSPVANRGRAEIENLIGFFVNTVALRLDLSGSPSVSELLQQTKAQSLAAQRHQDIPFEQVVELAQPVRSLAHTPLFQVMFAWQNATEAEAGVAGAGSATASLPLAASGGEVRSHAFAASGRRHHWWSRRVRQRSLRSCDRPIVTLDTFSRC